MNNSDSKFFTNEEGSSLYNRFQKILKGTQYFDVLVGYFYLSGFHRIQEEFKDIEKVRILVGLNIDKKVSIAVQNSQQNFGFTDSEDKIHDAAVELVSKEIESADDDKNTDDGMLKLTEYLISGKVEIKAHPSQSIHAKVYIMRHNPDGMDYGRVITGSSNFTEGGLVANREFNVELKDKPDVSVALEQFEILWEDGVPITQDIIDTVKTKSHFREDITLYDLYLKFLYEYFKEEINTDQEINIRFPKNFLELEYQKEAVINAHRILDDYNGVFLSDVVGLGKTYMASMLMQTLQGKRMLVICPPGLIDIWQDAMDSFLIAGATVISLGKLDKIIKDGYDKYNYVIVDEAHRFRNEITNRYGMLHEICKEKKVILVSATPLNNKLEDIESQLKLFMSMKNSPIPGKRNLEAFFQKIYKDIGSADKGSKKYLELIKEYTAQVRENILRHVMVRRTRTEIQQYYADDIAKQGITFPEITPPQQIIYEFNADIEKAFDETINHLRNNLKYARYTPLLYLINQTGKQEQPQKNIKGFMRSILIKRLESSFFAFQKSVGRFIKSYENFIKTYNNGEVYIGRQDIFEILENDDDDRLDALIIEGKIKNYNANEFQSTFLQDLQDDLEVLKKIASLWKDINDDPKLDALLSQLKQSNELKDNKIIIFSEAKETTDYLYDNLSKHFPKQVISLSSEGGMFDGVKHNYTSAKKLIDESYDPMSKLKTDNALRILITTDILSEGVNMHRSNVVLNYDLPWNPTKVLQRVGRVNRIGTKHSKIYIFNFFPTSHADEHLGLEANIVAKINAFHSALGEDARYLYVEEEELTQHGLTGQYSVGEKIYQGLQSPLELEKEENSMLGYIKLLRDIRDKKPDLFEKIKELPKKIVRTQAQTTGYESELITFFRKNTLKRFICSTQDGKTRDLTFMEAVSKFSCTEKTKSIKIPNSYYDMIATNKGHLSDIDAEDDDSVISIASNQSKIIDELKALLSINIWSDEEQQLIANAKRSIADSNLSKKAAKDMFKELEQADNPQQGLSIVRNYHKKWLPTGSNISTDNAGESPSDYPNEVILSKCFYASNK